MSNNLTVQEEIILQEMNHGMYLMTNGNTEGLAFKDRISNVVKSGSVKVLVDAGLIFQSDVSYKNGVVKYLLTPAGRKYRKI